MAKSVGVATIGFTVHGIIGGISPWDTTLWFGWAGEALPLPVAVQAMADGSHDPLDNFTNVWGALNESNTAILGCTVRGYDAGASAASTQAAKTFASSLFGTATPGGAASQACCSSLHTAHAGRSGRGRLYWPATATLAAGYQLSLPVVTNLATATKNLYHALAQLVEPGGPDALVGVVRSLTTGTVYPITRISTNSRPDRQEHREGHLTFQTYQVDY